MNISLACAAPRRVLLCRIGNVTQVRKEQPQDVTQPSGVIVDDDDGVTELTTQRRPTQDVDHGWVSEQIRSTRRCEWQAGKISVGARHNTLLAMALTPSTSRGHPHDTNGLKCNRNL